MSKPKLGQMFIAYRRGVDVPVPDHVCVGATAAEAETAARAWLGDELVTVVAFADADTEHVIRLTCQVLAGLAMSLGPVLPLAGQFFQAHSGRVQPAPGRRLVDL